MSRSYKKPYIKEVGKKYYKRQANKRVRKADEVGSGKSYRKHYETWNITDFCCYCDEPKYRRK